MRGLRPRAARFTRRSHSTFVTKSVERRVSSIGGIGRLHSRFVAKALLPELTPAVPALTAVDGDLRPFLQAGVVGLLDSASCEPPFDDLPPRGVERERLRRGG